MGETVTECITKLVSQYLDYSNFIAAAKGLLIGAKAGIDLQTLAFKAGDSVVFPSPCRGWSSWPVYSCARRMPHDRAGGEFCHPRLNPDSG